MILTPGAYLRRRREAARISPAEIAEMFHTEPRWSEIERRDWLARIEADVEQPSFRTLVALRGLFAFDFDVLGDLVLIAHGAAIDPPRLCRCCACSERDACDCGGQGCAWVADDLCSACAGQAVGAALAANDAARAGAAA